MNNEPRSLNLMNAEHVALLAYMQRYVRSITKEGKKPGEAIQAKDTSFTEGLKKTA
jgi:hypothetical protein